MKAIGDITCGLVVKPGDLLLIGIGPPLHDDQYEQLRQDLEGALAEAGVIDVSVLIVDRVRQFAVIRPDAKALVGESSDD